MSRGQLARTPDNFPNMKYRARKRHQRAANVAALGPALARVSKAFAEFGTTVSKAFAAIDWDGIARSLSAIRRAAQPRANATPPGDPYRCDICQGTGDSNGADWCEECQGTGRILPPERDPDDVDDEPELAPPMIVEVAEQHRQDDALRRSADLAIERGHIRTSPQ
ncbi:hypothetical protein IU459_11970 [Nocardia amamiensis]|uniref:Uncharacterized protein n=1 Tax=Nocardia amamiensis TaxID=404578 RepID=A0ABS0CU13_9NOCA|nr:hypothetical protein [Nocardia amamiensis]MBF6298258.1 hypothetical protein [Nocardia amamiensis]